MSSLVNIHTALFLSQLHKFHWLRRSLWHSKNQKALGLWSTQPAFLGLLSCFYFLWEYHMISLSFHLTLNSIPMSMVFFCLFLIWKCKFLMNKTRFVLGYMPSIKSMACHTLFSVLHHCVNEWQGINEWTNMNLSKREAKTVIWKSSLTGFSRLIVGTSYFRGLFLIPRISFLVILPSSHTGKLFEWTII